MRVALLALAACTQWRQVPLQSLQDDNALVVTRSHAYEMTNAHVRDDKIVGRQRVVWSFVRCPIKVTNESPEELAGACGWSLINNDARTISIDPDVVRTVRAKRVSSGRTALAVGAAVLVAALAFGGYVAYAVFRTPTH